MKKKYNIIRYIVVVMIFGIVVGYVCYSVFFDLKMVKEVVGYVLLLFDVFLCLIKMIIVLLVFVMLIVGIV